MNFVAKTFKFLSQGSLLLVFVSLESIKVLFMPDFLLFLGYIDSPEVLLELSGVDAVLILDVFKCNLRLFFQFSQLIKVLEHEMLTPLSVDFLLDLMLFGKIL
jgi:hypothetical protein